MISNDTSGASGSNVSVSAPLLTLNTSIGPDSVTYQTYTDAQGIVRPIPNTAIGQTWTENEYAKAFRDSFARYTTTVAGQTVEHTDTQAAVEYLVAQLTDHIALLDEVKANMHELATVAAMQKQVIAEQRDEIELLRAELAKHRD